MDDKTKYWILLYLDKDYKRKGVNFVEVPTVFVNRRRGTSNFSLKEITEAFTSVWKIKFGN